MQGPGLRICLFSFLVLAFCERSLADPHSTLGKTLYRWTDNEGTLHLSDRPPTGQVDAIESEPLPVAVPPPADRTNDDYYSVENQARRLAEERQSRAEERERTRNELEERRLLRAQLEAARAQKEAARAQQEAAERSPGYLYHHYPVRPYPAHPIRPRRLPERRIPPRTHYRTPLLPPHRR